MEIVSGRTGKPHVTSQQFRQLIEGTVGQESCILTSGENLEPELASNNSLKIRSGMLAHHGNISSVKIGTYDEVGLSNGSQGMKRIDLVVCRYTKNAETEVESCDWVVIMGTPAASNPVAPAYTVGNLQDGDLVDDCPIFEVHYDGINVTEVKKLVSVVSNLTELNSKRWQLICSSSQNGDSSVPSLSKYSEILIIFGYSGAGQCQETAIIPMDYFRTGRTVIIRDSTNGQGVTIQCKNDTTIITGSLSDSRWGVKIYVK